jgi:hypothetical protein
MVIKFLEKIAILDHGKKLLLLLMRLQQELQKGFHLLNFCNLWEFSIHKNGRNIMILVILLVLLFIYDLKLIIGAKLLPEFLDHCDFLEDCFKDILTPDASIRVQFENFLIENFSRVQHMTEREFHKFVVKLSIDSAYGDYIKYILL